MAIFSYTERFTWASPLALAVLLRTAGFDIISACQDASFDRDHGPRSIPARFGAWLGREWRARLDQILARVFDHLGLEHALGRRWRSVDV